MKDTTRTTRDQDHDQDHTRYADTDGSAHPAFRTTPETLRYAGALSSEVLAQLLAPGETPLEDEQLCTCGHLEADHRVDGPCKRCMRCHEFAALETVEDPTVPGAVPTEAELVAELARAGDRAAAREKEITGEIDEQRRRRGVCGATAGGLSCDLPRGHHGLHSNEGDFEWNFDDRAPEVA